ncbi:MAG: helix-turn-helix domain-containing protein [Bacteroidota bacterium]
MTENSNNTNQTLQTILAKLEAMEKGQKTLLDLDECAEYSGYSKSYLYKLTSLSQIPHYKPGGKKIFFKRSEIDAWLLRNPVKTQEELDREADHYMRRRFHR